MSGTEKLVDARAPPRRRRVLAAVHRERPQLIFTEPTARDAVIVLTNSGNASAWEQARALGAAAETRASCRHCPLRPSSPGVNLAYEIRRADRRHGRFGRFGALARRGDVSPDLSAERPLNRIHAPRFAPTKVRSRLRTRGGDLVRGGEREAQISSVLRLTAVGCDRVRERHGATVMKEAAALRRAPERHGSPLVTLRESLPNLGD